MVLFMCDKSHEEKRQNRKNWFFWEVLQKKWIDSVLRRLPVCSNILEKYQVEVFSYSYKKKTSHLAPLPAPVPQFHHHI